MSNTLLLIRSLLVVVSLIALYIIIKLIGSILTLSIILAVIYYLYKRSGWNVSFFLGFGIGKVLKQFESYYSAFKALSFLKS